MQLLIKKQIIGLIAISIFGQSLANHPLSDQILEKTKIKLNFDKLKPAQKEPTLDQTIKTLIGNSQKVSLLIFTKALSINIEKTKFQNIYSIHIKSKDGKLNKTIFSGPDSIKKSTESAISKFQEENPEPSGKIVFLKKYGIFIALGVGITTGLAFFLKNRGIF